MRICNLDSCGQSILCRGQTSLFSQQPWRREIFCSQCDNTMLSNFLIIANLKDAIFHFCDSHMHFSYDEWVWPQYSLKSYAYTLSLELSVYTNLLDKVSTVSVIWVASVIFPPCFCFWKFLLYRIFYFDAVSWNLFFFFFLVEIFFFVVEVF